MFSTQYTLGQYFGQLAGRISTKPDQKDLFRFIGQKFGDLSEQVGYLSVKSQGAKGDGKTSDYNAISNSIVQASLSGRGIEFPAGTYYIDKNITLYDCKFHKGAKLLPANNTVTITHKGHINAGSYQIWDFSLGGFVDPSQANILSINARWLGLVGDGNAHDDVILNYVTTNLRAGGSPLQFCTLKFDQNLKMGLYNTVTWKALTQVKFVTETTRPGDAYLGQNIASFVWKGAASGVMVNLQDCGHCSIEGFFWDCGTAGVGLDIDQDVSGYPRICTECEIKNNSFLGGVGNKNIVLVRIANISPSNVEYMLLESNRFWSASLGKVKYYNGGIYAANGSCTVTCTSGNTLITFGSNVLQQFINNGYTTVRFRCNGLGTGAKGTLLDTTLTITSATTGTCAVAPNATLVAGTPYFLLDDNDGIGVQVSHQNSKKHIFYRNTYNALNIGINMQGGSFNASNENFPDCDINILVANPNLISEPCVDRHSNSENSRVHILVTTNPPYACEFPRMAPFPSPGAGIFAVGTGGTGPVTFRGIQVDNNPSFSSTGASVFQIGAGCNVFLDSCTYASNLTLQDIGLDTPSIGNLSVVRSINQSQSGGLAIQVGAQEFTSYNPSVGRHDVLYTLQRTSYILFLPDLNADPSDLPHLQNELVNYSGSMWLDHSGASSILRIEEKDFGGTLNTRYIYNTLRGSTTYDPPSIASLGTTTTTVTVTGVSLGDKVKVAFSLDTQGIMFNGYVSSSNTVTVVLFNPTAGAINLASGTLSVTVEKS